MARHLKTIARWINEFQMIKWQRSQDGFVDSHCGHWKIRPLYCSCVKPQFFDLYRDGKKVRGLLATQRDAKAEAERLLVEAMLK